MVGVKRFLLARHVGATYSFSLATYTVAQPKTAQPNAKRQTLAEAAVQPMVFAAFSGNLVLRGLTLDEHALFSYQNGVLVKPRKTSATVRENVANATNGDVCVTVYTCYWQSYCSDNRGGHYTTGAMTQSTDGCSEPPGQEACGIDNWGMSWDNNGYDTRESCTYVEDPSCPAG